MKTHFKNNAIHLTMILAMAFAFSACEEKKKPEAEQPVTEEEATPTEEAEQTEAERLEAIAKEVAEKKAACPDKSGSLQTAEVTFLELADGGGPPEASFRLADGEEIWFEFDCANDICVVIEGLKKDDKVSITYQEKQYFLSDFINSQCREVKFVKAVKILPK